GPLDHRRERPFQHLGLLVDLLEHVVWESPLTVVFLLHLSCHCFHASIADMASATIASAVFSGSWASPSGEARSSASTGTTPRERTSFLSQRTRSSPLWLLRPGPGSRSKTSTTSPAW